MSASATSSATPPASIYNSNDSQGDNVSDVIISNDDGDDDNNESKGENDKMEDAMFFCPTQPIINNAGWKKGMAAMEDHCFRSFFGAKYA